MTPSVPSTDPVQSSLHVAIIAARKAQRAVYAATSGGEVSQDVRRGAHQLERRLASDALFDPSSENELRKWCDRFEMLCLAEKQTSFVYDEHCMSGGYEEVIYSCLGRRLAAAQQALAALADAPNDVHCHLEAERLAEKLRA